MAIRQERLAFVMDEINNLAVPLRELEQLRERVRKAELRELQLRTTASRSLSRLTNRSEHLRSDRQDRSSGSTRDAAAHFV